MQSGGSEGNSHAAIHAATGAIPPLLAEADQPADIFELLRRRHPPGEWAFMEEVGNRPQGTSWADAIAVNLWQSRGHVIHGFEVKVSRSDWLRELKRPEKAEPVMRYCHFWWLVAEKDITKPGELPDNWGHVERRGNSLVMVKAAPRQQPDALSLSFFASLVRRAHDGIEALAAQRYASKLREATEGVEARVRDAEIRATEHANRRFADLERKVTKFEKETGIQIGGRYDGPPIEQIKFAQQLMQLDGWGSREGRLGRLVELAQGLEGAGAQVRKLIEATGLR